MGLEYALSLAHGLGVAYLGRSYISLPGNGRITMSRGQHRNALQMR